jgi:beta-mannosidase
VQVPAQSNNTYFTVDKATWTAKADPHRSFLVFDFGIAGKKVSRNLIFFDVTHALDLPVAPKIETTVDKAADGYTLTLRSSQLARNVYVSFGDLNVETEDNYFDLLPSEPMTIRLKSSATLEQIKASLKTMSLTEAFNAK